MGHIRGMALDSSLGEAEKKGQPLRPADDGALWLTPKGGVMVARLSRIV
ncbi:hypothetical protein [Acetobacter indonesiensis]|nr:hypothetical protein [Acetobacter indonesiensis]